MFKKSLISVVILVSFLISFNIVLAQWDVITDVDDVPQGSLDSIIINVINWLIGIVAIVAILIIVFAGFQWAMASGDQEKVDTARKWLISAVTGLIIALAAWAIVNVAIGFFDLSL